MNRRVYMAGPISNGHAAKPRDIHSNVMRAVHLYELLIHDGWTPVCPHLSYFAWLHFDKDVHWPRWIELDLDLIDSCAAVFRFGNSSKGADLEVKYAKDHNIPVVYTGSELKGLLGEPEEREELKSYLAILTNGSGP